MLRPYRGKLVKVKKGGVNVQLCAQEKALLKSLIENWINRNEKTCITNKILKRDLAYYSKTYSKLTGYKKCPFCGKWV